MANKNKNINEEVLELISQGDNDRVEFRHHTGGPNLLSKIISSFANASGGKLIIGVGENGKIYGCKKDSVMETFNKAKEKLIPCPDISIEFIILENETVAVITIAPAEKIVASSLGVFIRTDNSDEIMKTEEISEKLLNTESYDFENTVAEMAQQITQLTISLEETVKRYRDKNKLSRKIMEWIACGIIGIILSMFIHL
ncbi:MAG: putative DNA binding domain-containing protein [Acetobacterium woodii]|nr:putative DNA binding domain-containing protein [Acetobacterium woodii]